MGIMSEFYVTVNYTEQPAGRIELNETGIELICTGMMCLVPTLQKNTDEKYEIINLSIVPINRSINLDELLAKTELPKITWVDK